LPIANCVNDMANSNLSAIGANATSRNGTADAPRPKIMEQVHKLMDYGPRRGNKKVRPSWILHGLRTRMDYCPKAEESDGAGPYAMGLTVHCGPMSLRNPVSLGWLTITRLCCVRTNALPIALELETMIY
jgi:hypothetical protein